MDEQKIYTVKEVANLLRIHWQTVLTYIKQGKLKGVKLGRGYRILVKDLNDFIDKSKTNL